MLKDKNVIISSLILGFFVSLQLADEPLIFVWAFLLSSLLSYLLIMSFLALVSYLSNKYGLSCELTTYISESKTKLYDRKKRDTVEKVKTFPLGFFFTVLAGILTLGVVFPLLTLNIVFKKREDTALRIKEKEINLVAFKIIIYALLILVLILSIIRSILPNSIFNILYRELFILSITYLFPWTLLTEYISFNLLKMDIPQAFTSDIVLIIDKKQYLAYSTFIFSLLILSYFVNPFLSIIISAILAIYVWYVSFKKEILE